jgi:hypothetical protein
MAGKYTNLPDAVHPISYNILGKVFDHHPQIVEACGMSHSYYNSGQAFSDRVSHIETGRGARGAVGYFALCASGGLVLRDMYDLVTCVFVCYRFNAHKCNDDVAICSPPAQTTTRWGGKCDTVG